MIVKNMAQKSEYKNMIKVFKALDANNDGVLTKEEINVGFKKLGWIKSK